MAASGEHGAEDIEMAVSDEHGAEDIEMGVVINSNPQDAQNAQMEAPVTGLNIVPFFLYYTSKSNSFF